MPRLVAALVVVATGCQGEGYDATGLQILEGPGIVSALGLPGPEEPPNSLFKGIKLGFNVLGGVLPQAV